MVVQLHAVQVGLVPVVDQVGLSIKVLRVWKVRKHLGVREVCVPAQVGFNVQIQAGLVPVATLGV